MQRSFITKQLFQKDFFQRTPLIKYFEFLELVSFNMKKYSNSSIANSSNKSAFQKFPKKTKSIFITYPTEKRHVIVIGNTVMLQKSNKTNFGLFFGEGLEKKSICLEHLLRQMKWMTLSVWLNLVRYCILSHFGLLR